jgi:hypothetical protein
VPQAEVAQLLQTLRILDDVDRAEVDAVSRKKLFRLEAGASAGLHEELVGGSGFHGGGCGRDAFADAIVASEATSVRDRPHALRSS